VISHITHGMRYYRVLLHEKISQMRMNHKLDRKKIAKQAYLHIEKKCKRPLIYQEANFLQN
jgi:hypothetical protein